MALRRKPRATIPLLLLLAVLVGLVVLGRLLAGSRERPAPEPAALLPASSTRTSVELTLPAEAGEPAPPAAAGEAAPQAAGRTEEAETYGALLHVRVVRRSTAEPVRGARVWVPCSWGSASEEWRRYLESGLRSHAVPGEVALTDTEGWATFRMHAGQRFWVHAAGDEDEMAPARTSPYPFEPALARGEERRIELVLPDELVLLRGWVVDRRSQQIGGAEVALIDATLPWAPRERRRWILGPLGVLQVQVAPWRTWALEASAPGFQTARFDLTMHLLFVGSGIVDRRFELLRSAALALEVGLDGEPFAGSASLVRTGEEALRNAFATAWTAGPGGWRAELDPEGRALLEDLPPDEELTLRVADPAGRLLHEEELTLEEGRTARRLELAAAWPVSGRVVDEAGTPLPGCIVRLVREPGGEADPHEPAWVEAAADPEGRFEVPALPIGPWRALVEPTPGAPAPDALVSGTKRFSVGAGPVELELVVGTLWGSLVGRVVDRAGAPIAGVPLRIVPAFGDPSWSASDAAGSFALDPAPVGEVRVHYGLRWDRETCTVRAGEQAELRIELFSVARIEGRLQLPQLLEGSRASSLEGASLLVVPAKSPWEPTEGESGGFGIAQLGLRFRGTLAPIEEGRFSIGGLELEHYDLVLVAEGLEGRLLSVPAMPAEDLETVVFPCTQRDPATLSALPALENLEARLRR